MSSPQLRFLNRPPQPALPGLERGERAQALPGRAAKTASYAIIDPEIYAPRLKKKRRNAAIHGITANCGQVDDYPVDWSLLLTIAVLLCGWRA
jgi:hypothetical protein